MAEIRNNKSNESVTAFNNIDQVPMNYVHKQKTCFGGSVLWLPLTYIYALACNFGTRQQSCSCSRNRFVYTRWRALMSLFFLLVQIAIQIQYKFSMHIYITTVFPFNLLGTKLNFWRSVVCSQALDARDAIAKSLYSTLFTWLVTRVNKIIGGGTTGTYDFCQFPESDDSERLLTA
jgi:hypothetical protein